MFGLKKYNRTERLITTIPVAAFFLFIVFMIVFGGNKGSTPYNIGTVLPFAIFVLNIIFSIVLLVQKKISLGIFLNVIGISVVMSIMSILPLLSLCCGR